MPELNGIEATRRMIESAPHLRVLVLSMHKEPVYVRDILKAGARGYILKDAIDTELLSADGLSRAETDISAPPSRVPHSVITGRTLRKP